MYIAWISYFGVYNVHIYTKKSFPELGGAYFATTDRIGRKMKDFPKRKEVA